VTKRTLLLTFLGSSVLLIAAPQDKVRSQAGDPVLLEVDSTKITLSEFEQKRPLALFPARNAFFEAERKALQEYADEVLLQRQAEKEHTTVAGLIERHVTSQLGKDPSEDALRVYYEGLDTKEPFEAVRPKILEHILDKRTTRVKTAYMESLRAASNMSINIAPPRARMALADLPVRGPATAAITLVEYADYECPYCQQAEADLDKLAAEYKGKIALIYKDLPLPMHSHAQKAAEAAQCAGLQNKYWEYHDILLKTKELEVPQLKASARSLGLNATAFDTCLDSGQRAAAVKATQDEAVTLGLQGTPSFFMNGRYFTGIPKYDLLRQMVEEELKRTAAESPQSTKAMMR
jgi:predicted DsbA family dithiol-disulfide isomerase